MNETGQIKIDAAVRMLEEYGPDLPVHDESRSERVVALSSAFRILYAFNPRRTVILLVGGDKTGDDRWYEVNLPKADKLYDQHLQDLKNEAKEGESQNG